MRRRTLALSLAALLAAAAGGILAVGPDRVWDRLGDPDLGPVSFESLTRRATPNDALVCPAGLCRATPDIASPIFTVPAKDLRRTFAEVALAEPRVVRVASADTSLTDRYIQRTRWLAFPDTIVVRFIDLPGGRATLAIYSRSKFGRSDFGVNRRRLESWLDRLVARVAPVPAVPPQN